MKTLILVRHGKSSWDHDVGDKDRPLKNRGVNDAKIIASKLNESGFKPDLVLSSPANRALSTCRIFMSVLVWPESSLQIVDDLYDFGGSSVVRFISSLGVQFNSVIVFGHNHAFTSIANQFGSEYISNLPTSGLVEIEFDIHDWKDMNRGVSKRIWFPRDHR